MRNEQEKADGIEEINEQETTKDVDSKETHGTTPGNSIINQVCCRINEPFFFSSNSCCYSSSAGTLWIK